ncbi:MAG: hypothetical protein KDK70_41270, partial [Myxococcales bacterium]|nr:hypothetical protein [Myxococcales bacterium]
MKAISYWSIAAVAALGLSTTAWAEVPDELGDDYPRGTYVEVDPSQAISVETPVPQGGPMHVLFLQRCTGGLTIYPGNGGSVADESGIVSGVIDFPPFPYGDSAWNDVVERTRNIFSPFNILVTDVDPSPMAHDEAVVCGDGAMAGFAGAGGVAPFSCGVIPNAITFTFADTLGNNTQLIAEVIGQEAAHAWGLDHEYLCEDPMTYLSGCGPKTFQDIDAQCGEFSPRQCSCGGNTQNSYQHIINTFGAATPDTQAPTAAITYPNDGDVFEPGAEFDITVAVDDDVQVVDVTLVVNDEEQGSDASEPFGPWPVTNIPEGIYDIYIEATDVAGNTTVSSVVTISVNTTGTPPPPDPTAGDGGSNSGGDSGDGGLDSGADGSLDGGLDGDGGAGAGALPPGYGSDYDPFARNGGCDCTTGDAPRGGLGLGLMLLGLLG